MSDVKAFMKGQSDVLILDLVGDPGRVCRFGRSDLPGHKINESGLSWAPEPDNLQIQVVSTFLHSMQPITWYRPDGFYRH